MATRSQMSSKKSPPIKFKTMSTPEVKTDELGTISKFILAVSKNIEQILHIEPFHGFNSEVITGVICVFSSLPECQNIIDISKHVN